MDENTDQELITEELIKFIQIFSRYCIAYTSNTTKEFNIIDSILKKLTTVFRLTPEIYKILNELAKKGEFKFIITLLSSEKINYEDHGELITVVFSTYSNSRMNTDTIIESRNELINLLLKTNSVFYQNKSGIIRNILEHEKFTNVFLCHLNEPINPITIKTLFGHAKKHHCYTWINNIKLNWLNNLPVDVIYYVIIGSIGCIRNSINSTEKNSIQTLYAHSIMEYIFNIYEIKNIPIDIILKCFYKNDMFTYYNTSKYPNFVIYHNEIQFLVAKLDNSLPDIFKIYYLCCILINNDCIDILSNLLKLLPANFIKQYFMKAVKNISNPHILSSFIAIYPNIYFVQEDINLIINTTIPKIYKNSQNLAVILYNSSEVIRRILERINKPIKFISLDIISKLINFNWYGAIKEISKMSIICPIKEATILTERIIRDKPDGITGIIIKPCENYIKSINFKHNGKEIIIEFADVILYMMINNIFEINYVPTDVSNYVNILAYQPILK
jgi:hypothetical protein